MPGAQDREAEDQPREHRGGGRGRAPARVYGGARGADRARGAVLRATIRAIAAADLRINVAAERLQVHPNTATYRLRRIAELTGRNPRRVGDLLELLTAIALDEC